MIKPEISESMKTVVVSGTDIPVLVHKVILRDCPVVVNYKEGTVDIPHDVFNLIKDEYDWAYTKYADCIGLYMEWEDGNITAIERLTNDNLEEVELDVYEKKYTLVKTYK
jgi:hypothetical protein